MWSVVKNQLSVLKTTVSIYLMLHTIFFISNYGYQQFCVPNTAWGYLYSMMTHGSSTCNILRDVAATSSHKITQILQVGNFMKS